MKYPRTKNRPGIGYKPDGRKTVLGNSQFTSMFPHGCKDSRKTAQTLAGRGVKQTALTFTSQGQTPQSARYMAADHI